LKLHLIKSGLKWRRGLRRSSKKLLLTFGGAVPKKRNEIRLFAMARNESLRLPYFIKYYQDLGVERFIFIDNGSTDDTKDIIRDTPNSHLYETSESFKFYPNWNELLFRWHGTDNWCLAVDIDEFLVHPDVERLGLRGFCASMDQVGATALQCILLDMYSDRSFADNLYRSGEDPLAVCPYYDVEVESDKRCILNPKHFRRFEVARFTGNMRRRVFHLDENLSKTPLFKYHGGMYLAAGRHYIDGATFDLRRAALLHMKYLQDFNQRVTEEAAREEHANNAASYKTYAAKVSENKAISAYCPGSHRLTSSQDLVDDGIITV
jgi:glycosyltransferase involved in cell wall biosynthesis